MLYLRDLPKYEAIRARAEKHPEVDPDAVQAFLVLLRVASDVLTAFEKFLAGHRLSQGSFTVLMVLYREPAKGLNPSDLATRCGVTRATMTGLLDGLERKTLIRRDYDQRDRRTVQVFLTDQGCQTLDQMLHAYYDKISKLMHQLSAEEKRQLTDRLLKVAGGLPDVKPDTITLESDTPGK